MQQHTYVDISCRKAIQRLKKKIDMKKERIDNGKRITKCRRPEPIESIRTDSKTVRWNLNLGVDSFGCQSRDEQISANLSSSEKLLLAPTLSPSPFP